jgi:thiopeptide-type bacteriocin biosynthesis protein
MSPDVAQAEFVASGFFALRTPLLPFDALLAFSENLQAACADRDPGTREAALAADRGRLRTKLAALYRRPEVRDALFIASPTLEEHLDDWFKEPEGERGQKIERALTRYFLRMAGRATPFGLFAGSSVGVVGAETRLVLAERARYQRHTQLDTDYLLLLSDALARQPELRRTLTFHVNSTLYRARECFRYLEVRRIGEGWTHHQIALEAADYLEATLGRARDGATFQALVEGLRQDDPGATVEEALEYIDGLIDSQVLISELRPNVTGKQPSDVLPSQLRNRPAQCGHANLDLARRALDTLDSEGLGASPARYRRIAQLLSHLPGTFDLSRLFQVDMVKPMDAASLGPAVISEILRGVTTLERLSRRSHDDRLARFRVAFINRYEDREVPLLEALDEENGIGFDTLGGQARDASSLLDDLKFPDAAEKTVAWGRRETILLGKLGEALGSGTSTIFLEPAELEEMAEPDAPPLPDAFAALATIAAASEVAVAEGKFQVLFGGVSGPSGARLMGRFCHIDPQLRTRVEEHIRAEEALDPDAVFAEIVHLPEGRMGNILSRPVLREFEIPYFGQAGVPPERRISVSDLRISVVGERIILVSTRLGRRVLPRLTSAHNFHMSQGIYHFLCALQSLGTTGDLAWDWGPLRDTPYLPRVMTGRLVLSRARWHAHRQELQLLGKATGTGRFEAMQAWRRTRGLPRWIALEDADNELPIDLENVLAVEALVELAKGREKATFTELFPGPDQIWATGPEGRFVHELVIPFVRSKSASGSKKEETSGSSAFRASQPVVAPAIHGPQNRSFPPGSEWLYAKLYTGPTTVDQLLLSLVKPVVEQVVGTGMADRWFFIRSGDPDWHLRLRFHGRPARLHEEVLPILQAAAGRLLDGGVLWRFQLDTYEREVERYGGPEGMLLSEGLFQADSEAVLALVGRLAEDARGDVRWRLAILGMDLLLTDLGFDLDTKRSVIRKARAAFAAEFRTDDGFRHKLGGKFRSIRNSLTALLDCLPTADGWLASELKILRIRSERLAPVLAGLRACSQAGRLLAPLTELAPSYLHMHANRLLRSAHRAQELVLYDFLHRLYESQAARRLD